MLTLIWIDLRSILIGLYYLIVDYVL